MSQLQNHSKDSQMMSINSIQTTRLIFFFLTELKKERISAEDVCLLKMKPLHILMKEIEFLIENFKEISVLMQQILKLI